MKNKTLGLAFVAAALISLATGCNDTLRQFINPIPGPAGNPGSLAHAIVLSTNPGNGQPGLLPAQGCNVAGTGSNLHIDVSGDSVVGVVSTGPNPQFLGKGGNRAFVLNCDNTISSYIALLPLAGSPQVVTQPPGPSGAISGGTSSVGNFYVTNSGSNSVSMISSAFSSITDVFPVGGEPVAVAGNVSNTKIYIVNRAGNSVTSVSTTDNTIIRNIPVGTSPIWAVMSADGAHVFVVNQGSNNISVIDTQLDQLQGQNPVIATISVGASPNYAVYESTLKRLYVNNTGSNSISVIDASRIDLASVPQLLPTKIADVAVSGTPVSLAALSDGTKAYAALGNCADAATNQTNLVTGPTPHLPNCTGNLVSVIDVLALRERKTLQVGAGVVSIDAAPNGSKVFVVSAQDTTTIRDNVHKPNCTVEPCLPGPVLPDQTFVTPSVSVIRTSDDSVLRTPVDASIVSLLPTFHTPQQSTSCVPAIDPNFNKTVPLPCPGQIPFLVRTFP
ncbi:MAG TPA: YncE family protein [Terriglobales bacterium]|nr:YncE family protein [Terriglobales bacterium]